MVDASRFHKIGDAPDEPAYIWNKYYYVQKTTIKIVAEGGNRLFSCLL